MGVLRSFREARGWSQADLAERLGLRAKGYISRLEQGQQACPLSLALKIQQLSEGEIQARSLLPPDKAALLPAGSTP